MEKVTNGTRLPSATRSQDTSSSGTSLCCDQSRQSWDDRSKELRWAWLTRQPVITDSNNDAIERCETSRRGGAMGAVTQEVSSRNNYSHR